MSFVYTVDSYRPIGGEVVVTQLAFKGMQLDRTATIIILSANEPQSVFRIPSGILH